MGPTRRAMKDAGVKAGDVDKILLVGGSTRNPAVQAAIEKKLGRRHSRASIPTKPWPWVQPFRQVSSSAMKSSDVLLLDVTPLSLGIETLGGVATPMIERNTTIPTRRSGVQYSCRQSTGCGSSCSPSAKVCKGQCDPGQILPEGIPQARGIPKIEVTFDIDANGS